MYYSDILTFDVWSMICLFLTTYKWLWRSLHWQTSKLKTAKKHSTSMTTHIRQHVIGWIQLAMSASLFLLDINWHAGKQLYKRFYDILHSNTDKIKLRVIFCFMSWTDLTFPVKWKAFISQSENKVYTGICLLQQVYISTGYYN